MNGSLLEGCLGWDGGILISNLFGQWMHGGPARTCSQVSNKNISKYSVHLLLKIVWSDTHVFAKWHHTHREEKTEGTQSKGMLYMQAHGSWQAPHPKSLLGLRAGYAHHTRSTFVERRANRGACLWGLAAFICVMIWDLMFFLPLTKVQISVCDTKIRMGY